MTSAHKTTTITLFRHAATEWSVKGRFAGQTDLPLSPEGVASVREYRERHGVPSYDEVLVSPLKRAMETAELLGYPDAVQESSLSERDYGEFEGLTTAEIRKLHPGWNIWADPLPGGEDMASFTSRADSMVARLREHREGRILIVSHAHWIRLFTARWLQLPQEQARLFRADTLGQTVVGWEREHPVLLAWNR